MVSIHVTGGQSAGLASQVLIAAGASASAAGGALATTSGTGALGSGSVDVRTTVFFRAPRPRGVVCGRAEPNGDCHAVGCVGARASRRVQARHFEQRLGRRVPHAHGLVVAHGADLCLGWVH